MDEATWIERATQGDNRALGQLVQTYQATVYNLAYRMLGDRMEAEDAAQESFIRAFRSLRRYDPERSFRTWLLAITANHCIDRLRRRRPLVPLDNLILQAATPDPETVVIRRESRDRVQQLLMQLSESDRAAVTLLYWYDCSYEEIVEMLDVTVSALKSRLYRARRAMAQALEGCDEL